MTNEIPKVSKFGRSDAKWKHKSGRLEFGDVFAERQGQKLDVTFIRWQAGEEAPFPNPLPYEEVLIILKGTYCVRLENETIVAEAGEVIYLREGATGLYFADNEAELIAVTSPPYRAAFRDAGRGHELDWPDED